MSLRAGRTLCSILLAALLATAVGPANAQSGGTGVRDAVATAPADSAPPSVVVALTDDTGARTEHSTAGLPDPADPALEAPLTGDTAVAPAVLTDEIIPGPFVVAALTWPAGSTPPRDTWFRVKEAPGWSGWLPVESDTAERKDQSRAGTEPFLTGTGTAIQVRIGGDPIQLPRDLELVLVPAEPAQATARVSGALDVPATGTEGSPVVVSAGGSGTTAPVRLSGLETVGAPDVITREEWGANPAYFAWEPTYAPLQAAVLHHTAGTNNYTAAQSIGIVQGIYRYHAIDRGWGDIGYNFLVDKYGQVFEGRQGSAGSPPREMVVGGHAKPANTGTLGVSALGDYTSVAVPSAIHDAFVRVIEWRFDLAGLDARDQSGIISPGSPTKVAGINLPRIFAHRDVASTTCPGDAIASAIPALIERVGSPERAWDATEASTPVFRWWSGSGSDWLGVADHASATSAAQLTADGYVRAGSSPQFYVSMSASGADQVAVFRWWHGGDKDWVDIPAGSMSDARLIEIGYSHKTFQYYGYGAPGTGRVAVNRWWSSVDRDWITLRQDEIPDAQLTAWGYTGKTLVTYALAGPLP